MIRGKAEKKWGNWGIWNRLWLRKGEWRERRKLKILVGGGPQFLLQATQSLRQLFFSIWQSEEVVFLHVLIRSSDSVLFEGYKKVLVKPQESIILIETDKAFYKPGETGEEWRWCGNEEEWSKVADIFGVKSSSSASSSACWNQKKADFYFQAFEE